MIVTPRGKTNIVDLGGGGEQRRTNWLYLKYDVVVNYGALEASEIQALLDFFVARKAALEGFYIYDLALLASVTFTHRGLYCGTADGATDTFDVPGRSTSGHAVYVDGAQQVGNWSILTGTGDGGADQVQFTSALTQGSIVTSDFAGFHRMRVRFAQDELSRELFVRNLLTYRSVALKGLKPNEG